MRGHFVKHFVTDGRIVAEKLSDREAAALWRLSYWIKFRDNTIMSRTGKGPMRQTEIAQVLGKSERQAREVLDALERRGVIESYRFDGAKAYRISERLVYRGGGMPGEHDERAKARKRARGQKGPSTK